MVARAWRLFSDEIDRSRDSGCDVKFWWRDDDACRPDPALARLYALAGETGVPLALACIPAAAEPAAFDALPPSIVVIPHGVDHRNRASAGEKKTEFPERESVEAALGRLAAGRVRLEGIVGRRLLAVLAPPWNRIGPALVARLSEAGFCGVSTFGARKVESPAPGLRQVNTHVDIIQWKGGRGFVGAETALAMATRHLVAKRTGAADPLEPTGWLTHHAVHDEGAWSFLARLFEVTHCASGASWQRPLDVFRTPG
ncbi:MAG: polysaccharide deacetylase family protein [Proteobacteria bacterium]|nr:polysaccharide deacetylase family protein [Pseudomonadota bacterium]